VGETVSDLSYTATFEDGKYSYGPEPTGATVSKWTITDTKGQVFNSASGNLSSVLVTDDISYTVTAKATHTAGNIPNTNKGNPCTDTSKQIMAGTKTKDSFAITGYRYGFAGATTQDINSSVVRSMANKKKSKSEMDSEEKALEFSASKGDTKVFFAYPASWEGTPYFEMFGLAWAENSNIVAKTNINVADARGTVKGVLQGPTPYKLYCWELDTPLQAETTKFRVWFK
jgi:hypothetical protein